MIKARKSLLLRVAASAVLLSATTHVQSQTIQSEGTTPMRTDKSSEPATVTSKDGTHIAFQRFGEGPPLVIVVGAFNDRRTAEPLARHLSESFTVFTYDRRGRGASGDTSSYSIEREIEDLEAVIEVAGGSAAVFGFSSGAVLTLRAAAAGLPMEKLVVFGAPIIVDGNRPALVEGIASRVKGLVDAGKRGEAVELFQSDVVGIPRPIVEQMRQAPFRPALEAIAHTLFYDITIVAATPSPIEFAERVDTPTLVLDGSAGPPWITQGASVLASKLPQATHLSVAGLTQDINPELLAPPMLRFLRSE